MRLSFTVEKIRLIQVKISSGCVSRMGKKDKMVVNGCQMGGRRIECRTQVQEEWLSLQWKQPILVLHREMRTRNSDAPETGV